MCFLYLTTLNLKFYCSEDPGTKDAIFLFAKVPDILENRENVMKLLDLLNFPLQLDGVNIKMVADIKLLNVLIGIHGTGCRYNCPFCEVRFANFLPYFIQNIISLSNRISHRLSCANFFNHKIFRGFRVIEEDGMVTSLKPISKVVGLKGNFGHLTDVWPTIICGCSKLVAIL